MTMTQTGTHHWRLYSVEEVAVIVDPFTGDSSVVRDPAANIGEMVGCADCGEQFSQATAASPCIPEEQ